MAFKTAQEVKDYKRLLNLAGGPLPTQEKIHAASRKYIENDYIFRGHEYGQDDLIRVVKYLCETSPHRAPGT